MSYTPTLKQLKYLTALAEHKHFGRAAEACAVTQSTLSAGLAEMEKLLGAAVAERTKRSVKLTPLGEDLAKRAQSILNDVDDLAALARASQKPLSGPLRLGVIPTIAPFVAPEAATQLKADYPDLALYWREDQTARLLHALESGAIDVALLAFPYPSPFETMMLAEDPFVLAGPRDHSLMQESGSLPVEDLPAEELLLLDDGHCLRDHALAACRLAKGPRRESFRATSLATLIPMCANGLGLTLLPKMALDSEMVKGSDLVTRPLRDAEPRQIGLAWRSASPRREDFERLGRSLSQGL